MGGIGWISALLIPLAAAVAASATAPDQGGDWDDQYDRYFRKYAKHYFGPHMDWRWFKAQGIAESNLRPDARSPAGAVGIMQILPGTFGDIKRNNPHLAHIEEPRWNIAAGIYYDRQLYRAWKKHDVPVQERLDFAFASYNAGLGTMSKAFRRARQQEGEVKAWSQLAPFAPGETRAYVARIGRVKQQL